MKTAPTSSSHRYQAARRAVQITAGLVACAWYLRVVFAQTDTETTWQWISLLFCPFVFILAYLVAWILMICTAGAARNASRVARKGTSLRTGRVYWPLSLLTFLVYLPGIGIAISPADYQPMTAQVEPRPQAEGQAALDAAVWRAGGFAGLGLLLIAAFVSYVARQDPPAGHGAAAAVVPPAAHLAVAAAVVGNLLIAFRLREARSLRLRHAVPLLFAVVHTAITAVLGVALISRFISTALRGIS